MRRISKTSSLCPECLKTLDAEIFEENGKVYISKTCSEHGNFTELYWGNYEMYEKARNFAAEGKGIENAAVKKEAIDCPRDCGLCNEHKTHTALANLVVTNRCDLNCWYCFFFAEKAGYVYEPAIEQIREMVRRVKQEKPIAGNAVQITGGEPTIRGDLVEIIKTIKEEGFDHIQLNSDGINLAHKPELAKNVREAGINTLYLSYDGTSPETNPKNHWETPKVLESCRQAGLGIVLVPTVIKSVNDHDVGNIIRFAFDNADIIRSVNFQPVSLVGRMPKAEREKYRITIPDTIQCIEEQTNGEIAKSDFYSIPCTTAISRFVEALSGKPKYEFTNHFACGMGTYVFKDRGKMLPVTRFMDVAGMFEYFNEKASELKGGTSKVVVGAKTLYKLNSFIDKSKSPEGLNMGKILYNVLVKHNYKALGVFHKKSLFIGMMHFMDLYNYDIERVKRCSIHYVTPDPKMPIIPFCAFNVIPQWYRDKVQREYAISIEEWEKRTGRRLSDDYYRRDTEKLKQENAKLLKEKQLTISVAK